MNIVRACMRRMAAWMDHTKGQAPPPSHYPPLRNPPLTKQQEALLHAFWSQQKHDVPLVPTLELDTVTAEEIGAAVRVLYGKRHGRRKRQRKRRHVTYKQRDAIAWLLLRLQQERRENTTMAKTRAEWINEFSQHMAGLSDYDDTDIADVAELTANDQEDRTGSADSAMWQNPQAAAQTVLNEWNAEAMEAADVPAPGQPDENQPTQTPENPEPEPDHHTTTPEPPMTTPESPQDAGNQQRYGGAAGP